jgi:phosphohistidine swiveling domain-containing protein
MAQFCVTGEFLTERARQIVLDDDWTFASRFLVDSLDGITEEQAMSVLKGTHRLAGASDITYVEEDEEGRSAVKTLYGTAFDFRGTVLHNGKRYQPYAAVDSFGIHDALMPRGRMESGAVAREWGIRDQHFPDLVWTSQQIGRPEGEHRAMHYADNQQRDFAVQLKRSDGSYVFVLFEPAYDSFPPWLPCFKTAQEAYTAAESTTPVDGHRHRYPQVPKPANEEEALKRDEAADALLSNVDAEELRMRMELEAQREATFQEEVRSIRQRVREYADRDSEFGWRDFRYSDPETGESCQLRAPGRAMVAFALSRTNAMHLRPAYAAISPPNMKLLYDNPLHTDAWLGCGFDLGSLVYDKRDIRVKAFQAMAYDIQKNLLGYKVHVLTSGGVKEFTGHVVSADATNITEKDVLVVPSAGVEYDLAAAKAGAIICEVGGPLAHLVIVSRERGRPIVRMEGAMKMYQPGMCVKLDLDKGEVRVMADFDPHIDFSLL